MSTRIEVGLDTYGMLNERYKNAKCPSICQHLPEFYKTQTLTGILVSLTSFGI